MKLFDPAGKKTSLPAGTFYRIIFWYHSGCPAPVSKLTVIYHLVTNEDPLLLKQTPSNLNSSIFLIG